MRSFELKLKTCTVTQGNPFDETGKKICPIHEKLEGHLISRGWERKHYHAENLHHGWMCNFRCEGLEKPENEGREILFTAEITIVGSGTACTLNMLVDSPDPENRLRSLDHGHEAIILDSLLHNFKYTQIFKETE